MIFGAPPIVTNGLVLNLDAGNSKSYPGTGTTWSDLSGNSNNGTLTNGPIFNRDGGGNILFDGVNDYVNIADVPFRFGTTFTLSIWIYWNGVNTAANILSKRNGSPYNQYGLLISNDLNGNPGNKLSFFAREDGSGGFSDTYFQYTMPSAGIYNAVGVMNTTSQNFYVNGVLTGSSVNNYTSKAFNITGRNLLVGAALDNAGTGIGIPFNNKIYQVQIYNRALSASEVLQNYNALKSRFDIQTAPIDSQTAPSAYETMTYVASSNMTVTNNSTDNVTMFKTSGATAWDNQCYSTAPFTAPCTIEFNKQAGATDNGLSYAMIGWNADPTTNANYTSLDYASYPFTTNAYYVYNNGAAVLSSGVWSTSSKLYVVYDTDGYIRHYNGSTLLYSVNYGTGKTVYVDSSFYSANATYGGFSNVRVRKQSWNGTSYV